MHGSLAGPDNWGHTQYRTHVLRAFPLLGVQAIEERAAFPKETPTYASFLIVW